MKVTTIPDYAKSYVSRAPSYVIFYVTSRCNMKCGFCFYADSLNKPWKDGLTLDEVTRLAKSLRNTVHLTLTGGEPFIRPDLAEVVQAFIEHAGTRNITIPTNGSFTDRVVAVLEKILPANPSVELRIALSIDGLGQKHDELRHSPGAFEKAERTFHEVKRLQEMNPNLHLVITTVANKNNKEHLPEFFEYASKRLQADDHALLLARGDTKEVDAKDISVAEYEALVALMESKTKRSRHSKRLQSRLLNFIEKEIRHTVMKTYKEKAYQHPCVAGGKFLIVYDSADVYPCEIIETLQFPSDVKQAFGGNFKIGNLRDHDFDIQGMLKGVRAQKIRDFIARSKCHCTFECAIAASIVFNPKTLASTLLRPPSRRSR